MFSQKTWSFTGASGTSYSFSILPKSKGLPQAAGVFILAYTHPCGHLAGWQVNPLLISHSDNMDASCGQGSGLDDDQAVLWNSNFVLLESDSSVRKKCVLDLQSARTPFV